MEVDLLGPPTHLQASLQAGRSGEAQWAAREKANYVTLLPSCPL